MKTKDLILGTCGLFMVTCAGADALLTKHAEQVTGKPQTTIGQRMVSNVQQQVNDVVDGVKDRIRVAEERKQYNLDPSLSYEQARIKLDSIHFDEACRKYGIEKPAEHDYLGKIIAFGKIHDAQSKEISDKLKELRNDLK